MDRNVLRRVLKGLGANAFGQVVTVMTQLVGVPILLHAWGAQLYGEWLILLAVPTYLSMTDLGLSLSASNDMSSHVGRGDDAGALSVFQSLAVFVYAMTGAGMIVATAALWRLPLQDWLRLQVMGAETIRWVLGLAAAEILIGLPNGVTHAGFRASGDYALHVGLTSTSRLVQFGGVWIAVLAGGGPVAAAAVFFAIRAIATPVMAMLLTHRHPWLRYGLSHARSKELHRLLKPAVASLALPCAQALNIQGMVLVVGAMLGPLAVVVLSTLRTLTRLALQLVLAVSHAAEPEIAAAYGTNNRLLMHSLFVHALRSGLWLALAAAAGLALVGSPLLALWTHDKVAMDRPLFACLLTSAVASAPWYSALTVLKAANQHMQATLVLVLASSASLGAAALLLVWTESVVGAGASLMLMDATVGLYTLPAAARLLGVSTSTSLMRALNPYPLVSVALRAWAPR